MSKDIEEHILQIYQVKKLLGSGAYGHVWRAIDKKTNKQLALKKIFDAFQNATDAQRTYREISILHELDHCNIIKLFRVIPAKNHKDLYLAFQFMQSDLHCLIGEGILQKTHIRFIAYQMLKAMKYLHSAQLLHRDLKPSNILINAECHIKICDFGLARSLVCQESQQLILSEDVATRWYRSPEMLLCCKKYAKPTDVWSIGCILAELMMGKPIFPGQSTLNQLERILEFTGMPSKQCINRLDSIIAESLLKELTIKKKPKHYFFGQHDQELINLVSSMLEFDHQKRITIDQALSMPMLDQFKAKQDQNSMNCQKIILPSIDDNLKLTVQQYRQLIYKDISRRYPNNTYHRQDQPKRSLNSFIHKQSHPSNHTHSLSKSKSRNKSQKNNYQKHQSISILQKIQNLTSPIRAAVNKQISKKDHKGSQLEEKKLMKTKSKKQLLKKKLMPQRHKENFH